jgi:uncharacterized protein (DUF58 family)
MAFGTPGWTKAAYAATLAATLARFLHLQGDAVGMLSFDEGVRDYLPARHRIGQLRELILALEKPAGGGTTDLIKPLQRITEIVRNRGLMVIVSDFLSPLDRLESALAALTSSGHEVVVFQVLDPSELNFDFSAPAVFEDIESGRSLFVDPLTARRGYLDRFQSHQASLAAICQKLGIARHTISTVQPLELALSDFFHDRLRRGRLIRRATARGRS